MLNLIIHNKTDEQTKKLNEIMKNDTGLFAEAQAGEDCYADSQGWLDTKEWAGEDTLSHIEALAQEIRKKADAVVLI